MPIQFYFRPEAKLVVCVHSARVTNEDFIVSYRALFENESFSTSMNLLIDLRRTDSSPRSRRMLEEFARFVKSKYTDQDTRPKIGVIAPDDLSYGLARMYEAFADSIPWEFAVFRTLEEALAWLKVPEDLIPREFKRKGKR